MCRNSKTGARGRLTHVESAPPAATIESTKACGSQQGAALMKRTTKYAGLDVHQATTVASVREEGGRVIARSVPPTDGGALPPPSALHYRPPSSRTDATVVA